MPEKPTSRRNGLYRAVGKSLQPLPVTQERDWKLAVFLRVPKTDVNGISPISISVLHNHFFIIGFCRQSLTHPKQDEVRMGCIDRAIKYRGKELHADCIAVNCTVETPYTIEEGYYIAFCG